LSPINSFRLSNVVVHRNFHLPALAVFKNAMDRLPPTPHECVPTVSVIEEELVPEVQPTLDSGRFKSFKPFKSFKMFRIGFKRRLLWVDLLPCTLTPSFRCTLGSRSNCRSLSISGETICSHRHNPLARYKIEPKRRKGASEPLRTMLWRCR